MIIIQVVTCCTDSKAPPGQHRDSEAEKFDRRMEKKTQNIQEDGAEFLNRPSGDTTTTSRHNQKPHDHAKSSGA